MRRAIAFAGVATSIILGWFAATAVILLVSERADAVTAVFARDAGRFRLPDSVALLEWNGRVGRFVGRREGYIWDLYAAGAIAVFPARSAGCLDLASSPASEPLGRQ